MQLIPFFIVPLLCFSNSVFPQDIEIGKPYGGWKEGEVDIHHIYTGRGESSFLILPDGTSLLIDAGDYDPTKEQYPLMTPMLPDSSRRSGLIVADYIKSFNPYHNKVDYVLISHFHSDHIGDAKKGVGATENRSPNYQISGITEVAEYVQFNFLVDRDYPNYDFPIALNGDPDILNYQNFIKWNIASGSFQAQVFRIGDSKQFVLQKTPKKFKNFSIQNLFANGRVWNKSENSVDTLYYLQNQAVNTTWNENTMSCGIRLNYGNFSYFTGGDLSGKFLDGQGKVVDIEEYAAKICGSVDVSKANHHAYLDAMTPGFIRHINTRFFIVPVWDYAHIQPSILTRMTDPQLTSEDTKVVLTHYPEDLYNQHKDMHWQDRVISNGHVVLKVLNKGKEYKIYLLDPMTRNNVVKEVYGPFLAKSNLK